jgi:hypothetical protein
MNKQTKTFKEAVPEELRMELPKSDFDNPPTHIKYIVAQVEVLKIKRKVAAKAAEGNHHSKNIIINSELRNATMARNQLAKQMMDEFHTIAEYNEDMWYRFKDR